jgi:hypothetical protein
MEVKNLGIICVCDRLRNKHNNGFHGPLKTFEVTFVIWLKNILMFNKLFLYNTFKVNVSVLQV